MKLRLTARINKGARPGAKPTALEHSSTEDWLKKYDAVWGFFNGLAKVWLNDKYGFVDKDGNEVVPPKYDEVGEFIEGLVAVQLDGKWGFVNKKGRNVIPPKYNFVWYFSEGLAPVLKGKWGFVNKRGEEVIPLKYNKISFFYDGLAKVWLNGKELLIDKQGEVVTTDDRV